MNAIDTSKLDAIARHLRLVPDVERAEVSHPAPRRPRVLIALRGSPAAVHYDARKGSIEYEVGPDAPPVATVMRLRAAIDAAR